MPTVKIIFKSVYGKEVAYPANETAEQFVKLTKSKTFSHFDLTVIASLGFKIIEVLSPTRSEYTVVDARKS